MRVAEWATPLLLGCAGQVQVCAANDAGQSSWSKLEVRTRAEALGFLNIMSNKRLL